MAKTDEEKKQEWTIAAIVLVIGLVFIGLISSCEPMSESDRRAQAIYTECLRLAANADERRFCREAYNAMRDRD